MSDELNIDWAALTKADMYTIIKQTEEQNAKLRERVAELEELTDGKRYIPQEWYQLATTENAKLRELVRLMVRRHTPN